MMHSEKSLVVVTVAGGWLGRGLVQALVWGLSDHPELRAPRSDLKIRCLLLPGQSPDNLTSLSDRIEIVFGDIRSISDCRRFLEGSGEATMFHTAGVIHPSRVREFYEVNTQGTVNVLEAATAASMKRVVVVSSNSPCGCNPTRTHRFDEVSPYNPYMHYGRSKMQMELAVKAIQIQGRLETVIVRAPWFYGPFQPARQTVFFRMIRDGKAPVIGDGENLRSMSYIENLTQGLLLAARKPGANGKTYWIADEQPYTMNEIIDTVERLLENEFNVPCAHRRLRLPAFLGSVAWCCDYSLQQIGFYHQKIHVPSELGKTIACTVEAAKRDLGYSPAISLEEGMRRSLKWVFQNKLL